MLHARCGRVAVAVGLMVLLGGDVEAGDDLSTDAPRLPNRGVLERTPLRFLENRGQCDPRVRFVAQAGGLSAFVGEGGFVVQAVTEQTGGWEGRASHRESPGNLEPALVTRTGVNLAFTFLNPDRSVEPVGIEQLPGLHHYLHTNDRTKWTRHVPSYAATRFPDVWDGVSLDLTERQGRLEFDVLLEPGADLSRAVLRCQGGASLSVNVHGELVIETPVTELQLSAPVSWEVATDGRRVPLASSFELVSDDAFAFKVPGWTGERPLCIDPGIPFGTYLGSTYDDVAFGIGVDGSGDVFVAGRAGNPADFPITPGVFQTTSAGGGDAFVSRFDPTMSVLRYSTFVSGSSFTDWVVSFHVDDAGHAFGAGLTNSTDFPTTIGAWDSTYGGGISDAYVFKLVADGSDLAYSTLVGGLEQDFAWGLDVHVDGTASITGITESPDFPVTSGAIKPIASLGFNAFYTRVSPDGSQVMSTYLPARWGFDIAVNSDGSAVIVGKDDDGLVTTPGAFDGTPGGADDGFVMKVNDSGSELLFSTYLGGAGFDEPWAVDIDAEGMICITGSTGSTNFPRTADAFDSTHNLGFSDAFITVMLPDGSDLSYSTFFGGNDTDNPFTITPTPDGALVVAGYTRSSNMPVTPDAIQPSLNIDNEDGFVVVLRPGHPTLDYSSYLGGGILDTFPGDPINDAFVTSTGNVYLAGATSATDLQVPSTAFQPGLAERQDGFAVLLTFTPWLELGSALAGASGVPQLRGTGSLEPASSGALDLKQAPANALTTFVVGLAPLEAPLKGGVLVPSPDVLVSFMTNAQGGTPLPWATWPSGLPSGWTIYFQAWIQDSTAPKGWAVSNALLAVTP